MKWMGLDYIRLAVATNSLVISPKQLMELRNDEPLLIRVQDPQTGAIKCRAPAQL